MFIDNNQNIYTKINFLDKKNNKKISSDFINTFQKALSEINNVQNNFEKNVQKSQLNNSDISLNDLMINLQKSSISLTFAIQVRNRIISAYKEIMNQQI